MVVMDQIKKAGADRVGMVTLPARTGDKKSASR